MLNSFTEYLLFSLAISFDSLVAFFGYGAIGIKIKFKYLLLTVFLNIAVLALGILLGGLFSQIIKPSFTKYFSFSILLLFGLIKLISDLLKLWLNKHSKDGKPLSFKLFNFNLFLEICLDPTKADINKDKILSLKESLIIGSILSIDSFGVGLGVGINNPSPYLILLLSFVLTLLFSFVGNLVGKKLSKSIKINLSWLSGLLLILLAITKLFN